MKDIKIFYEIKQTYSETSIEEIKIEEVTIEDGELWFRGFDKDGYEVLFSDRCIGTDFFINFEEAKEVYDKIMSKKEKKNEN